MTLTGLDAKTTAGQNGRVRYSRVDQVNNAANISASRPHPAASASKFIAVSERSIMAQLLAGVGIYARNQ
jgi:hypothetical protein